MRIVQKRPEILLVGSGTTRSWLSSKIGTPKISSSVDGQATTRTVATISSSVAGVVT